METSSSSTEEKGRVTDLLGRWREGDRDALNQLMQAVHSELRRMAQVRLRGESPRRALQATELVHETYLRLVDQTRVQWNDRAHFFAIAAKTMRRVLVDHARRRNAVKRGKETTLVDFGREAAIHLPPGVDVLDLETAMSELHDLDPRQTRVVELLCYGGMTLRETAHVLEMSVSTVKREWLAARAWLYKRLSGS